MIDTTGLMQFEWNADHLPEPSLWIPEVAPPLPVVWVKLLDDKDIILDTQFLPNCKCTRFYVLVEGMLPPYWQKLAIRQRAQKGCESLAFCACIGRIIE